MHKSWHRPKLTRKDRELARRLADPTVDEAAVSEYIRRECEAIQVTWTETQRARAAGEALDKRYEIEAVASADYWINGQAGVRQG